MRRSRPSSSPGRRTRPAESGRRRRAAQRRRARLARPARERVPPPRLPGHAPGAPGAAGRAHRTCTTWTSRRTSTATASSRPWRTRSPGCSARRPPRSSRPARWPSRWRCAAGRAAPATRPSPCTRWPTPRCTSGTRSAEVSGLRPVRVTSEPRLPTADEVRDFEEPFGTLMLELPLRDAGFVLPSWEELTEVVEAAHERDAVVHFDGARLWESTVHFGRPLDEIAGLADSVYVSFYKSLDGCGGAVLAGPKTLIDEAKVWRHRYGGQVFQQFPTVAVGPRRPGAGAAPAARVRGPRARGRRRAARGVRGGRGAVDARPPRGAAHPRVPGLAAVRRRRRSRRPRSGRPRRPGRCCSRTLGPGRAARTLRSRRSP